MYLRFKRFYPFSGHFYLKPRCQACPRHVTISEWQIRVYIYSPKSEAGGFNWPNNTCNMHMKSKRPSSIMCANQQRVKCVTVWATYWLSRVLWHSRKDSVRIIAGCTDTSMFWLVSLWLIPPETKFHIKIQKVQCIFVRFSCLYLLFATFKVCVWRLYYVCGYRSLKSWYKL